MHTVTLEQHLNTVNKLIVESYSGHTLESALQRSLWFNSIACAERPDLELPEPVTVKWAGMDNRARYLSHLQDPHTRQQLVEQGWLDSEISYTLNSWGFRSDSEYDTVTEPCIITMGCSFTFGTGLHLEQTWPYLLAQRMGVRLVNLAVPGHGLDLNSLWLLLKGSGIANPIALCVYEPPPGRISWLQHHSGTANDIEGPMFANTMRNMLGDTVQHNSSILWSSMINDLLLNSSILNIKNFHILTNWCNQRGVPLLWDNAKTIVFDSLARDLAHYGWEWHVSKSNWFYKTLKG